MKTLAYLFFFLFILPLDTVAQEEAPPRPWMLSDKIIEFAVPMFIITMVLQALVTIIKIRANQKLKERILEKEGNHEAMFKLFNETERITKLEPLKWAFLTMALAVSFFTILSINESSPISELLSLSIVFILMSLAFLAYYLILNRKK
ncbi:MAG: hypothetical protein JNN04_14080 [Cyclobacteriaceae bacterium]|nr:hypothetical protein [Cyclobacteriaceae bacterium]